MDTHRFRRPDGSEYTGRLRLGRLDEIVETFPGRRPQDLGMRLGQVWRSTHPADQNNHDGMKTVISHNADTNLVKLHMCEGNAIVKCYCSISETWQELYVENNWELVEGELFKEGPYKPAYDYSIS